MYGAWILRRNLRAFSEVVESCNIDELKKPSSQADLSESQSFLRRDPFAIADCLHLLRIPVGSFH